MSREPPALPGGIAPGGLQDVFRHMVAAGRGSIVNVSSISGQVGVPGIRQASYAASKLGLSGLTAELAVQWARHSLLRAGQTLG